jgi:peroxiredoxin
MKKIFYSTVIIFSFAILTHAQDVNSKAPDFNAKDMDGKTIHLSDLKGKVVLIDFWASWCVPCKKSMPHLIELYNAYKDTSFTAIGVNVDTEKDKVKQFEEEINDNIPFPVIFDKDSEIPPLYEVEGMPTTVVVNKQGIIKYKEVGYTNELKEKLDKIIKDLTSQN